ncbi:MAG: lactonase family protein [Chloroflexi bacterium]|nr:lactonase family protein [Chloroflexota bacterium]
MPFFMYVSISEEDRLRVFSMDGDTGKLEFLKDVAVLGRPAPLCVDPQRRFLYVGRRRDNQISSYRIDQDTGDISPIGSVALESDPCFLSTDRRGRFVLAAYYNWGGVTIHPIGDDGAAYGPPIESLKTGTGAHSIQADPSNRYAFVPHIAGGEGKPNAIFQFRFDERTGHLTPNVPARVRQDGELGPRHFCFHPRKNVLYFSNEQACSVTAYSFDPTAGTLAALQTVSTLPQDFSGRNSCSQIQIAPSGRFLYAPNRGHDTIACFTVDADSGRLTPIGHAPSEKIPRAFSLDPQGKFLYAAGLESGRLASYRVADDGALDPLEIYDVGKAPMWVLIVEV